MAKIGKTAYLTLSLGYFAAALGYAVYGAFSGTGIYRVMRQWQLAVYDVYSGLLDFAIVFAALAALGVVLVAVLARGLIPAERSAALAHMAEPRAPIAADAGRSALPRAAAALGFALLAGGIVLGYALAAKARQDIAFEDIDLSQGQAPTADFVRATGIARTDLAIEIKRNFRVGTTVEFYVPISGRDWHRGQPLAYFLRVTEKDFLLITFGQVTAFSPKARPSLVTLAAAPDRSALPSRVAAAFGDAHLSLAEAPVVLDLELHPYLALAREAAWLGSAAGLFLVAAGLLFDAALRQSSRRKRAL